MELKKVTLLKGKEISMQRRHPWIFSGAIAKKDNDLKEGDMVEVFSAKNEYLATGYYANGSIAIRIISFEQGPVDEAFWVKRISAAWQYRQELGILNENTNCCRIFFGEVDGVPGLILDYFDDHVVMQSHSYGIYLQKEVIVNALQMVLDGDLQSVYDKSAETLSKHFATETNNQYLFGKSASEVIVKENGHAFIVDMATGQKTGFFLDQRDNG